MPQLHYIVVSPPMESGDALKENWLKVLPNPEELKLAIAELGVKGDHYHVNYVVDTNRRGDSMRRTILGNCVKLKIQGNPDYLVRVSQVKDISKLVGAYLQKEINHEVLFDSKKWDLQALKKEYDVKAIKVGKWVYVPTMLEFPLYAEEYMNSKGLDIRKYHVKEIMKFMAKDRIAIHHLLRHAETLQEALCMYFD